MPYGMQIRSASSGVMINMTQTLLRRVASILVPYASNTSPTTYSVPAFNDTKGMFIWRDYLVTQAPNSYSPVAHIRPFISANWNNTSKVLTVNHVVGVDANNADERIQFIFLHYR